MKNYGKTEKTTHFQTMALHLLYKCIMKAWSIVAVEVSMAAAGIAMIGLMVVVSFL